MKLNQTILETTRLILRPIKLSDAQAMFDNWAQDLQVTQYLTWQPHKNIQETKALIKKWLHEYVTNDRFFLWAIEWKETNEVIGTISCPETTAIGYCIAQKFWHQGITSEALAKVLEFLFLDVKLNSVYATHLIENQYSGKVLQKCGMRYIKNLFVESCPSHESAMYQLTREEYCKHH